MRASDPSDPLPSAGGKGWTFACALVVASLGALPGTARAQDRDAARRTADALSREAFAAIERGDLEQGCRKLQASHDADPRVATLLNLGNCLEKTGRPAGARSAFLEAATIARATGRTDWERTARQRADAATPRASVLLLEVSPEASRADAALSLDGRPVPRAAWASPLYVDPGSHELAAAAPGLRPWRTVLLVTAEPSRIVVPVPALEPLIATFHPRAKAPAQASVDTAATPPAQAAAAAAPGPPPFWSTPRTVGAVAAGAGVVALAIGSGFGLAAQSRYVEARALCTDAPRGCPPNAVAQSDSAYGLATASTALFIGGGAALAGGAALFFLGTPSAASSVAFVGPAGSVGLSARGAW